MKLSDIDLSNIKIAIFDFDQTLAIHKDKDFVKHCHESEENFLNFSLNAYLNPNNFYEEIEPCTKSNTLYKLIDELRKRNIKIYCLTGMKFSFNLKAKQAFVDKNYGSGIEVISTSTQGLKLQGAKIIQKINHCNLNEILFIDDKKDVIDTLVQNDIKGIFVDDINNMESNN